MAATPSMDRITSPWGRLQRQQRRFGQQRRRQHLPDPRPPAVYVHGTARPSSALAATRPTSAAWPGRSGSRVLFSNADGSLTTKEDTNKRVNAPSNWSSTYSVGSNLTLDVVKFIHQENVAVTTMTLTNKSAKRDQAITVAADSTFATGPARSRSMVQSRQADRHLLFPLQALLPSMPA